MLLTLVTLLQLVFSIIKNLCLFQFPISQIIARCYRKVLRFVKKKEFLANK